MSLLLIATIGKEQKNFSAQPPCRKDTAILNQDPEPYEISARFYRALQAKALSLENDARQDEAFAATLENPGHFQRQILLVETQRDQARRLRDFLAASRTRIG